MVDGRQLADFSLVDQPTIGLRPRRFSASQSRIKPASIERDSKGHLPMGVDAQEEVRHMLHTGLSALNWGLPRLGVALAVILLAALVVAALFVTVLVGIQAATEFGQ